MIAIAIILGILYIVYNLITAKLLSAKEMKNDFVDGQCTVGKILTNIFYAPAWILKGIRFAVTAVIK